MFRRMTRERYLSDAELARFMAAVRERRHVHQRRDYAHIPDSIQHEIAASFAAIV